MIDERVKYWTQGWPDKNFGDYLTEYLCEEALVVPLFDADRYRLIGSAIDTVLLQDDLQQCAVDTPSIALWGCGKRDAEPLDAAVLAHCHFFGVRGPLTRDALALPADTPLGDPAFVLPLVFPRRSPPSGRSLCVPHFNEPLAPELLRARCGADDLARPAVADFDALEQLVDRIASARFVLAGSLHAAIVACAYGVPFGFWDTGFVDVPFKWKDFAASLGVELPFFATVAEAEAHHTSVASQLRRPRASTLLAACPFAVRPSLLAAAWCHDAGVDAATADVLRATAGDGHEASRAAQWRQHAAQRRDRLAAGGERGLAAHEARQLAGIVERLGGAAQAIETELRAATFAFEPGGADLSFAAGSAGAAFLRNGWTAPNEVGPWAVERHAMIELPPSTRWRHGGRLDLGVIAFAPQRAPLSGVRVVRISANDMKLGDFVIRNEGDGDVVFQTLSIRLPEVLSRRGGRLQLVFESDVLVSASELGIGTDTRTLSFAPTYMKAVPA